MYEKKEGYVFDRPVKTLKEYVEVLRLALDGHKFSFSGEIFKYTNAELGFNPTTARLPIYIGASGPKTLAVAGAIADGVYPKAFLNTDLFKDAVRSVCLGAKVAGRKPSQIEVVRSFILSICRDSALAKKIAKGKIIFHLLNDPQLIPETDVHADIKRAIELGNLDEALSLVPDTAVDTLTVSGTPEECKVKLRDYVARFGDLGVETFRVQPLGPTPNEAFMSAVDILSAAH
jgi:5,10-methylenetetrahydromethanopterin reductase